MTMLGRDIESVYVLTGPFLSANFPYTGCGLKALFEVVHPRLNYSRLKPEEKQGKSLPNVELTANACPSI
jgi:hypothetical protein